MVLPLKRWKSRSSPGFEAGVRGIPSRQRFDGTGAGSKEPIHIVREATPGGWTQVGAGWSSPVARQAHNLKVAGSNPAPATNQSAALRGGFFVARGPTAHQKL